jgi:tRNA A-37 threonylcarbamoyl transferase component Bud32
MALPMNRGGVGVVGADGEHNLPPRAAPHPRTRGDARVSVPAAASDSSPKRWLGERLGGYRLLEFLGTKAGEWIFDAEEESLGRHVTIKILPTTDPAARLAFLQLARINARLEHDLCLPVLAAGEAQGVAYAVRPRWGTRSVADRLRTGPVSAAGVTRWCKFAARALAGAHQQGIAHGRLGLEYFRVDDADQVKLMDFGVEFTAESAGTAVRADLRDLGRIYDDLLSETDDTALADGVPPARELMVQLREDPGSFRSMADMAVALAQVETLLRQHETVLTPALPMSLPAAAVATPTPPPTIGVGSILGRCLIVDVIGKGATGTVFRGVHQTLGIPVAVKIIKADYLAGNAAIYEQFRTEARLLAQLNHPNIVRLWDFEDDPAFPYLVLEHVDGFSAAELIHQCGCLQPDKALRLVQQVTQGLAAAQTLGIVHRDIKPANILITKSEGTAKLADLGLAMVNAGEATGRHPAGGGTGIAGTVAYMPPEQATHSNTVDFRADIYSLGASFYHMLTGQLPHTGRSRMEILLKHATQELTPPHELVPGLAPAFSHVIARMMAKDAAERFASYADLAAALAALEAKPTQASTPPAKAEATNPSSTAPGWKSWFGAWGKEKRSD